jgi:hypothetical protein
MADTKLEPVNLGSIARGALMKLFEVEIQKIAANIADRSTPATAKREITLKIEFKPDTDRRSIDVTTSAGCRLASVEAHASRLYTGKGVDGQMYLFDEDPRQEMLFAPPAEDPNMLQFPTGTAGGNGS